ncbi:MAG: hypothetical protein F6K26_51350 [Moorea sp. SIO2I5]|nr:hypothetical protein [Moorena sp. SIO2I5]
MRSRNLVEHSMRSRNLVEHRMRSRNSPGLDAIASSWKCDRTFAYCLLPLASCLASCLLPIALPIAYCLLPIASCLLPFAWPFASCLLPLAPCPNRCHIPHYSLLPTPYSLCYSCQFR